MVDLEDEVRGSERSPEPAEGQLPGFLGEGAGPIPCQNIQADSIEFVHLVLLSVDGRPGSKGRQGSREHVALAPTSPQTPRDLAANNFFLSLKKKANRGFKLLYMITESSSVQSSRDLTLGLVGNDVHRAFEDDGDIAEGRNHFLDGIGVIHRIASGKGDLLRISPSRKEKKNEKSKKGRKKGRMKE